MLLSRPKSDANPAHVAILARSDRAGKWALTDFPAPASKRIALPRSVAVEEVTGRVLWTLN